MAEVVRPWLHDWFPGRAPERRYQSRSCPRRRQPGAGGEVAGKDDALAGFVDVGVAGDKPGAKDGHRERREGAGRGRCYDKSLRSI